MNFLIRVSTLALEIETNRGLPGMSNELDFYPAPSLTQYVYNLEDGCVALWRVAVYSVCTSLRMCDEPLKTVSNVKKLGMSNAR